MKRVPHKWTAESRAKLSRSMKARFAAMKRAAKKPGHELKELRPLELPIEVLALKEPVTGPDLDKLAQLIVAIWKQL